MNRGSARPRLDAPHDVRRADRDGPVLVAGATGTIGREVVRELLARGRRVRALVRDRARAADLERAGARLVVADVLAAGDLDGAADGASAVVSALGESVSPFARRRRRFHAVDLVGNRRLLALARAARVPRFGYVSVFGDERWRDLAYFDAHRTFAEELAAAEGVVAAVARPVSVFGAWRDAVTLARRRLLACIGDGSARTNPIHEGEVATALVDGLEADGPRTLDLGGPETFSRRELLRLCRDAAGRGGPIPRVPAAAVRAGIAPLRLLAPARHELLAFLVRVSTEDCVAPAAGRRRIGPYLRDSPGGGG